MNREFKRDVVASLVFTGIIVPIRLCIDHDHETGRIRGLLCWPCNTALGAFNDSKALLLRAIDYIE